MNQLSRISPVSDADAARAARASTLSDLAGQITATPVAARPRRNTRVVKIMTPVVAGLAAAAVLIALAARPAPAKTGSHHGHPAGTARLTAALSFRSSPGYLTVTVVNPLADPSSYRAEFAEHHLDVILRLVPVSPSLVGTLVYFDESTHGGITPITAQGRCYTGGGGGACPVGVRIPATFRGQAHLVFGRAARPGEQYESTASATAPGEVMHGMTFAGDTVAQVLAALRQRDVTVPVYNYNDDGYGKLLHHVPGGWYVYDADPWAPRQVMLSVGPVWPRPVPSTPAPGAPAPTVSPTAG